MFFGDGSTADEKKVRGDPGEVERRECTEEVSAIDGAETKGKDEVVDDAGPEVVGHTEVFRLHEGELFEAKERVGGQDERPDIVKVGVGETEGLEHGGDIGWIGDGGGVGDGRCGLNATCALPEGGFGVDVGEEGAGDLGEETVDVGGDGLLEGTGADVTSAMEQFPVAASLRGQTSASFCPAAVKRCARLRDARPCGERDRGRWREGIAGGCRRGRG